MHPLPVRLIASCLLIAGFQTCPWVLAQTQAPANEAIYRALGGQPGLQKIMRDFLRIILADVRIQHAFVDADMERLEQKLTEQLCMLSGGPCTYKGKDMQVIHEDMKISNAQFNALTEDLQIAMENNGVPTTAQNRLIAKLAPMQREIVTK